MQQTKKKSYGSHEDSKKKERHIVTWTQQEDDILRQQISLNGTENWAIIASKFKDKTTRQCRRRWYTYLNSDFKKGGWSPEEDMLLCEAQKIFGNRWTEIAKVVSGRTDNAVKNRFSTLCKKRAKYEALAKQNKSTFINSNNKRVLFNADGTLENVACSKKIRRSHILDDIEHCKLADRSHIQCGNQQHRPPFAVLAKNIWNAKVIDTKEVSPDEQNRKTQATFLRKDDPKIAALMQQAELLSSLALKVNTENTEQSLENAWKVLQDFLNQSKENDIIKYKLSDIDFQFEDFRDLIEDLRSINDESQQSWRQTDLYDESPASSEYSTGSTVVPCTDTDKIEETQTEIVSLHKDIGNELEPVNVTDKNEADQCEKETSSSVSMPQEEILPSYNEQNNDIVGTALSSTVFNSPLQVIPIFRSLAAGIPSPKFSESERNFLLKTLGAESPCPNTGISCSQPPPCRRALLQSL